MHLSCHINATSVRTTHSEREIRGRAHGKSTCPESRGLGGAERDGYLRNDGSSQKVRTGNSNLTLIASAGMGSEVGTE